MRLPRTSFGVKLGLDNAELSGSQRRRQVIRRLPSGRHAIYKRTSTVCGYNTESRNL